MFVSRFCTAVIMLITLAPVMAYAGSLDSPADPTDTGSAMYTLTDIYNRLDTGTATAKRTGAFTEPTDGPDTATGRTLDEIMAKAPAKDDTNGALASHVLLGKTFWGLTTSAGWGSQTGSIATQTLSNGTTTVSAGYYEATTLDAVDADLVAANIGTGTTIFGIAGSAISTAVPKTGQTTSYATGDDGDLEKGVAWPTPRFTDNGNGTVTDNLTGLIWLKDANAPAGTKNWANALSYCNGLASGTAGLTDGSAVGDWRLPNVRELQSLIDSGNSGPSLPSGHPFTNVQSCNYWSGTTPSFFTIKAWYVYLYNGNNVGIADKTNAYCVWPVRAGQ